MEENAKKKVHYLVLLLVLIIGILLILLVGKSSSSKDISSTLIAIQMKVTPEIYASKDSFQKALEFNMQRALEKRSAKKPILVVFPEDVGLGLIFTDEYDLVKGSSSFREAAFKIASHHQEEISAIINRYHCSQARAILLMKGKKVQSIYKKSFSRLARKYHVTIVAGSAPIPSSDGKIYNACFVFGPTGKVIGIQYKVHLVELELEHGLDLTAAPLVKIHAIPTEVGRIGVAICYDAFFDDVVDRLVKEKSDILIQPSFNVEKWTSEQVEDWKNGMWNHIQKNPSLKVGVNPMMVGGLWDIQPEGISSIITKSGNRTPDGYLVKASDSAQFDVISIDFPLR